MTLLNAGQNTFEIKSEVIFLVFHIILPGYQYILFLTVLLST